MPPDPLQLCRHYGLSFTKILATPLAVVRIMTDNQLPNMQTHEVHHMSHGCLEIYLASFPAVSYEIQSFFRTTQN